MEALELIEELEELIDKGVPIPLTGRCMLDKEELLDIIQEIRVKLPDDLKQAKWVKDERQRILQEAQKEAGEIKKEAEDKIISMINEHEIAKRAVEQANELMEKTQKNAKEIKTSAFVYTDNMLEELESSLLTIIKSIEGTIQEIHENRQELRK